jgi:hypothetical protein
VRSERRLGRTKFRPIDYMRTLVIDEGFFNQSAMEQLLGVHAVLRSKNGLTPPTLLEMDEKSTTRTVACCCVPAKTTR